MQVSEELARYIVALQSIKDAEVGLEQGDLDIRDQLEAAFPAVKRDRENSEFKNWLWSVRVEQEESVIKARARLERQHGLNEGRSVEALVLRQLDHAKTAAMSRLLDDGDQLRLEWELSRRILANGRKPNDK